MVTYDADVWLAAPPPLPPVPAATSAIVVVSRSSAPFPLDALPPRDPWIASGLSLAVNGLGQIYNGDDEKAWWLLGAWGLFPLAWAWDAQAGTGTARVLVVTGMLGAKAWACWDAWQVAERQAQAGSRPKEVR